MSDGTAVAHWRFFGADERDGFLLGAGFSRAVSARMPLADELRQPMLDAMNVFRAGAGAEFDAVVAPSVELERGLSWLADPQPFATFEANLRHQALFFEAQRALAVVMRRAEWDASGEETPNWLAVLVDYFHFAQCPVVTFNYDRIIEQVVRGRRLNFYRPQPKTFVPVTSDQIVAGFVPHTPVLWGQGSPVVPQTFRLYKLHGSLDWLWDRARGPGEFERLDYGQAVGGEFPVDLAYVVGRRDSYIVPPTWSKSSVLRGSQLETIWTEASQVLRKRSRLWVLGYSIPTADVSAGALLSEVVRGGVEAAVVASRDPAGPARELHRLGVPDGAVEPIGGDDPIPHAVAHLESEVAYGAARALESRLASDGERPVCIALNTEMCAPVTHAYRDGDAVVLASEGQFRDVASLTPHSADPELTGPRGLPLAGLDLVGSTGVFYQASDGSRLAIGAEMLLDVSRYNVEVSANTRLDWIQLRPLGLEI